MPVHRYGNSLWYSEKETQEIADAAELRGFEKAKEQAAEEAWRTCKSRSRSLSESRMVTASNEASKCARVCKSNILQMQPEAKR